MTDLTFTMRVGFDGWYEVEQNGDLIAKFLVRGDAALFLSMMKELTR